MSTMLNKNKQNWVIFRAHQYTHIELFCPGKYSHCAIQGSFLPSSENSLIDFKIEFPLNRQITLTFRCGKIDQIQSYEKIVHCSLAIRMWKYAKQKNTEREKKSVGFGLRQIYRVYECVDGEFSVSVKIALVCLCVCMWASIATHIQIVVVIINI